MCHSPDGRGSYATANSGRSLPAAMCPSLYLSRCCTRDPGCCAHGRKSSVCNAVPCARQSEPDSGAFVLCTVQRSTDAAQSFTAFQAKKPERIFTLNSTALVFSSDKIAKPGPVRLRHLVLNRSCLPIRLRSHFRLTCSGQRIQIVDEERSRFSPMAPQKCVRT